MKALNHTPLNWRFGLESIRYSPFLRGVSAADSMSGARQAVTVIELVLTSAI